MLKSQIKIIQDYNGKITLDHHSEREMEEDGGEEEPPAKQELKV